MERKAVGKTYGLREVAETAGVTYTTVYRWVQSGYLPATKVGGRWRVDYRTMGKVRRGTIGPYKRREYPDGHPRGGDTTAATKAAAVAARKRREEREAKKKENAHIRDQLVRALKKHRNP